MAKRKMQSASRRLRRPMVERLEERELLAANYLGEFCASSAQKCDSPGTAQWMGVIDGYRPEEIAVSSTLSRRGGDVDYYRFALLRDRTVSVRISPAVGTLRLLSGDGTLLQRPAGGSYDLLGGRYYLVKASGNPPPYAKGYSLEVKAGCQLSKMSVGPNGVHGAIRSSCDTSWLPLQIYRPDGKPIDPTVPTVVNIHGANESPASMESIRQAISIASPDTQILDYGWTAAARVDIPRLLLGNYPISAVSQWAHEAVRMLGMSPELVSLVSFSAGTWVADDLAANWRMATGHKVRAIVALDPANDLDLFLQGLGITSPGGETFDPRQISFRTNASWSWAFHSSLAGSDVLAQTAHESFLARIPGKENLIEKLFGVQAAHSLAKDLFAHLISANAQAGTPLYAHFSLSNLLDGKLGKVWKSNPGKRLGTYEAQILVKGKNASSLGGNPWDPISLQYVSKASGKAQRETPSSVEQDGAGNKASKKKARDVTAEVVQGGLHSFEGWLGTTNTRDVFRVSIPPGRSIAIAMLLLGPSESTEAHLLKKAGRNIKGSRLRAGDQAKQFVLGSGTYYLRVRDTSAADTEYRLVLFSFPRERRARDHFFAGIAAGGIPMSPSWNGQHITPCLQKHVVTGIPPVSPAEYRVAVDQLHANLVRAAFDSRGRSPDGIESEFPFDDSRDPFTLGAWQDDNGAGSSYESNTIREASWIRTIVSIHGTERTSHQQSPVALNVF